VHHEALMVGLMLAGMEIGLRSGERLLDPQLLGGCALIVCASAVKLPAILAAGFLGLDWARRRGGKPQHVAAITALMVGIAVAIYVPLSVGTGVGVGWAKTLDIPTLIMSWMSVTTDLGLIGGQVGVLGGLGNHTDAVLAVTRAIGLVGAACVCVWLLLATFRGRIDAITGMSAGLAAVVLLGPVVHPWYLLWAVIPLAATRGLPRYRRAVLATSAVLAVVVPPTGADFNFRAFQLPLALLAAVVLLVLVLLVQRRQLVGRTGPEIDALPWRVPSSVAPVEPASVEAVP
jgi:alpha-1,6-mannosyltransferase